MHHWWLGFQANHTIWMFMKLPVHKIVFSWDRVGCASNTNAWLENTVSRKVRAVKAVKHQKIILRCVSLFWSLFVSSHILSYMKNYTSRFIITDTMQINMHFEEWPNAMTLGPHAYLNSSNPVSGQQAISRSTPYGPTPARPQWHAYVWSAVSYVSGPSFSPISLRGDDTHGIKRDDPHRGPDGLTGID